MAAMSADVHEDEDLPCYRHPDRLTALACISCERPICPECAVRAPVGFKCPDCAKQSRSALGKVPAGKMALGAAAGTFVAFVGGTILGMIHLPLIGIFVAYGLGMLVGTVARKATGGFRDHNVATIVAIMSFIGLIWYPVLSNLSDFAPTLGFAFDVIAAFAAAAGAYNRAS